MKPSPSLIWRGMPTYADMLSDVGYTCALSGKWHLGDSVRPQHGFADWFTLGAGGCFYYHPDVVEDGRITVRHGEYVTDLITDRALRGYRAPCRTGQAVLSQRALYRAAFSLGKGAAPEKVDRLLRCVRVREYPGCARRSGHGDWPRVWHGAPPREPARLFRGDFRHGRGRRPHIGSAGTPGNSGRYAGDPSRPTTA